MKQNRNEGFSLVELIIVIAIMSTMLGILIYQVSATSGYNARECNKKISSTITATKITTLSKATKTGDIYLEIYQDTDGCYYAKTWYNGGTSSEDPVKLSKKRVSVSYANTAGVETEVKSSQHLYLCFNRSSGALCDYTSPFAVSNLKYIYVSGGSHKYSTQLEALTGKVVNK